MSCVFYTYVCAAICVINDVLRLIDCSSYHY